MKILNYIKKLIQTDSAESSKRFISLFTVILITVLSIWHTSSSNFTVVLGTLCSFVLALVGVSAWEKIKK